MGDRRVVMTCGRACSGFGTVSRRRCFLTRRAEYSGIFLLSWWWISLSLVTSHLQTLCPLQALVKTQTKHTNRKSLWLVLEPTAKETTTIPPEVPTPAAEVATITVTAMDRTTIPMTTEARTTTMEVEVPRTLLPAEILMLPLATNKYGGSVGWLVGWIYDLCSWVLRLYHNFVNLLFLDLLGGHFLLR